MNQPAGRIDVCWRDLTVLFLFKIVESYAYYHLTASVYLDLNESRGSNKHG